MSQWHPEIQVRQVSLSKTWARLCVQKDKSPVEGEAESSFIHQALGVHWPWVKYGAGATTGTKVDVVPAFEKSVV